MAAASEDLFVTPYDGGVAFYQTSSIAFDADWDLWLAQVNFGGVEMVLGGACGADFNGDGALDILDLVCFQDLFRGECLSRGPRSRFERPARHRPRR